MVAGHLLPPKADARKTIVKKVWLSCGPSPVRGTLGSSWWRGCLPVTFSLSRNDTEPPLVRCHPLAMQGDAGKLWKKLADAVATLSWADAPV